MMVLFFFKHKTAYELRISDWSSDVCSSDLPTPHEIPAFAGMTKLGMTTPHPKGVHPTIHYPHGKGGQQRARAVAFVAFERKLRDTDPRYSHLRAEIGRAACRERVCQSVLSSSGAVALVKTNNSNTEKHATTKQR